ncbi:protoporphyrinogen oxidase [Rhizophagus irregularis]|uniref:Protoporphyrinogen oxidase n=1 Tax=Rhizophagus irregularis TaxID=588596 RepID=A0A2N0QMR9_9GLOM|nr:protoporphyrinogen oxidase [Rhizophagus irregularis]
MKLLLEDLYIERCNKETEEVISQEAAAFLTTPVKHLKQNLNEFLYIESPAFDPIKTDAITLELDDVFKTYMVLLGFKVQKKHSDGLWDLNIPLDFIEGFKEELTISEVIEITYNFLLGLTQTIEQQQ